MEFDAAFWALIGLVIFLAIALFMGVPGMLRKALDARIKTVTAEIEEARRLREEAQALLAEYQRRRQGAEREAEEIVANARAEAARMTEEAEASLAAMIERRTRAVETKIAQAETQALAEVKSIAAGVALAAAERILESRVKGPLADELLARGIADVKARLN